MLSRDDQKLEVQQATDIVRLIGEHVALKARGKSFLGLCPFHDDKNPSLNVSPVKQIYKCFSCGAGGDAFSFVQNYHKMTFPEALRFLAERAGIKLVERRRSDEPSQGPTERQRIIDANARAANFYRALFRHAEHGRIAREYVQQRRISAEMIEAFQIGYAPDLWDGLVTMIREKSWDRGSFELGGLVSARSNAPGHYDRLRHRLIFPICDSIGRVIAFGGRKLRDEDEPKYLNSPETPVFNKSATLFGLHLAKKAISDTKVAVIVEGYTDVIACHQGGVRNVIATLGTALTAQHVTELRRYCEKVVLVYDGDAAGVKATDRAIEVFLTGELDVAMAILPDEMDPAEIFELPDALERWNRAVDAATPALDYQFDRIKSQFESAQTVTGRQRLIEGYLQRLGQAGLAQMSPIRRSMVIQRLCALLHMNEQTIQDLLHRLAPAPRYAAGKAAGGAGTAGGAGISGISGGRGLQASGGSEFQGGLIARAGSGDGNNPSEDVAAPQIGNRIKAVRQAERHVIGCLLRDPGLFHLALADGRTLDEVLTPTEFITINGSRLYGQIYQQLADPDAPPMTLAGFLAELASNDQQDLANLATLAESEVEQTTQDGHELAAHFLRSASDCILTYRREEEYQQTRQRLMEDVQSALEQPPPAGAAAADSRQSDEAGSGGGEREDERVRQIAQLLEQRRANPSPVRIARLSG